jgi:hypothetical protein
MEDGAAQSRIRGVGRSRAIGKITVAWIEWAACKRQLEHHASPEAGK